MYGGVYQVKTLKVHMVFFFPSIEFAVLFNGLKVENVYCVLYSISMTFLDLEACIYCFLKCFYFKIY